MKNCKNCNSLMTEFDMRFEENLRSNEESSFTKCFYCHTRFGDIYKSFWKRENAINCLKQEIPFAIIVTVLWSLSIAILIIINIFDDVFRVDLSVAIWICESIIACIFSVWGATRAISNMDLEVSGPGYYEKQLVSTVSSDGKIVTKTQNVFVADDDDLGKRIGLFITYPFWCVLRPIIAYIISAGVLKKKCPKEIIKIFNKTKKEVAQITIPKKLIKAHYCRIKAYNKEKDKTRAKYSILGKSKVDEEISKIQKPILRYTGSDKKYIIVETMVLDDKRQVWDRPDGDLVAYLMLYRDSSGEIMGTTLVDGYFVCSEKKDWSKIWLELAKRRSYRIKESYSKNPTKAIEEYGMYL